jgi:phage minor structural protein
MRPVLFAANATTFTSNGFGRLDPTKCVVIEERNGLYELQCVVPVNSVHFDDIANNMILAVVPGDGMSVQAFRIYRITEPMNGLVGISARHISYDLSYNTVMPFTASSCSAALTGLASHTVETNMFTMWTDKSTVGNFAVKQPETFRSCLGGRKGSILDLYGGEYEWDNWTVKLKNQRGSDTNVILRYGKNITDIEQEQNLESVITGIVPFWVNDETVVTLPEKSVDSTYASQYPYKRTVPVDFSSEWEDQPTAAQLRAKAQSYITANNIGLPKISIQVSFIALWQTEEYKDIAPLERVKLCDTVGVEFEQYDISARAKVVRTEWDCLTERYLSIGLGEAKSNFASTLIKAETETSQEIVEAKSDLQKAIDNATNIITGTKGGYLKLNFNADNEPYELLIMNTDSVNTATKIWRWNLGGLGYSSTGYEGPYGTAITQDGAIVADFITTGVLNANIIKAGILQDSQNKNFWNLATGEFKLSYNTKVDGNYDYVGLNVPTEANTPASNWTTDALRKQHIGNVYYCTSNQKRYVWKVSTENIGLTLNFDYRCQTESNYDYLDIYYKNKNGSYNRIRKSGSFGSTSITIPGSSFFIHFNSDSSNEYWGWLIVSIQVYHGTSYTTPTSQNVSLPDDVGYEDKSTSDMLQSDHPYDSDTLQGYYVSSPNGFYQWVETDDSLAGYIGEQVSGNDPVIYDFELDQKEVFNRLTNDGTVQGIYMENGNLYINATYIATGILADPNNNMTINLTTGAIKAKKLSVESTHFNLTEAGVLTCDSGDFEDITISNSSGSNKVDISGGTITTKNGTSSSSHTSILSAGGLSFKRGNTTVAELLAETGSLYGVSDTYLDITSSVSINDYLYVESNLYANKVFIGSMTGEILEGQCGLDIGIGSSNKSQMIGKSILIQAHNSDSSNGRIDLNGDVYVNGRLIS